MTPPLLDGYNRFWGLFRLRREWRYDAIKRFASVVDQAPRFTPAL